MPMHPLEAETSIFTIEFDGETVGTATVLVQSAEAAMLAVNAPVFKFRWMLMLPPLKCLYR